MDRRVLTIVIQDGLHLLIKTELSIKVQDETRCRVVSEVEIYKIGLPRIYMAMIYAHQRDEREK